MSHELRPLFTPVACVALCAVSLNGADAGRDLKLTFDRPAAKWTEALPVGNGRIGAMVFGGPEDERLQINEGTLWGGSPHDYANPKASSDLDKVRHLIFAGKASEAQQLSTSLMGDPKLLMPYQPFCDVRLHFPGHGQFSDYHRELDLENAVAETVYTAGSTEYRREVFVSYPDQVLAMRIAASRPGETTFSITMDAPQPGVQVASTGNDALQLTGQIQPRQSPPNAWVASWDAPGMRFAAVLSVRTEGGSVRADGVRLEISRANAVTILFSNATSFRTYRDIGGDALAAARNHLRRVADKSYDELRQAHVADFQPLFSRVQLRLGTTPSFATTDQRIKSFAADEDPGLLALYFAFGRYLLISSSRRGGQPANLQGIWNQDLTPAWGSKWTTNINLEMNYWQADTGDLWETQEPLWSLIDDLRVSGANTAKAEYRSKGWVLHHNTDLWRATAPVDGFWGIWPMGQVWLANQMWDHYEFSGDSDFLARHAYPAMKAAAEFILDTLVEAPAGTAFAGYLVTNPSTSPENAYFQNRKPASLTYAATMDLELIRELFENCREASTILKRDADFSARLQKTETRLPPLQIGKRGQLQEWIEDYEEAEPKHRHVSHLYAVYPGRGISLTGTPDFASAAKKTLELRGDGGTGWSSVWRAALWARLRDPARAYANLKLLMTQFTLQNMFDLCPPFQIDGNLGGPAAITEMLLQSTPTEIRILPALPREWPDGSLSGVRVRGGGRIDISWKGGRLAAVSVRSDRAANYRIVYGAQTADIALHAGRPTVLDGELRSASNR